MSAIPSPRKKKNKNKKKNSVSLPLRPILEGKDGDESLYKGFFKYGYIIVDKPEYVQALWENGFFGERRISSSQITLNEYDSKISKEDKKGGHIKEDILHLCPEEALFLSYALGVLILTNEEENEMNIDDMWSSFSDLNPYFPVQYAVYHHMRCKGWVVKPGLKFGSDWVLYPLGPPFYHSQFLVWIHCLWEDTLEEDLRLSCRRSNITDISSLERLASHVSKSVLLCQVLRPRDLVDTDLASIECLKKFVINEVLLQHWTTNMEIGEPVAESSK